MINAQCRSKIFLDAGLKWIDMEPNFFFNRTDKREDMSTIMTLKKGSSKMDRISVKLLKNISGKIITKWINLNFIAGACAAILKRNIVFPTYKCGDPYGLNNLRFITILSIFVKILKKIIRTRLLIFFNPFQFFNKLQFCFTPWINIRSPLDNS